jgi:hypothetical protein
MDHADDDGGDGDNNVFIYMGGRVPQHLRETITHVRIHKSVNIITARAFEECYNLVSIEMHDSVEIIEGGAFYRCFSLRSIKLSGVRVIEQAAFGDCTALEDVEFGDKLEAIGRNAFYYCTSLRSIKLSKVRIIGVRAFAGCQQLTEVALSEDLETIEERAFFICPRFRCISIPLKNNLLGYGVFEDCDALSQVDIVGGVHKTISSLLLDSWRDEMNDEIDSINRDLPNTDPVDKTDVIRQWMGRVLERLHHYKSEHYALLKNNTTQLELALWKANLPNIDAAASRHEARVTCGANIIIPHVLSFLNDADEFPLLDYGQH